MKTYEFKEELYKHVTIGDYLTTGLPENNLEIERQINHKRDEYKKNVKKWCLTTGLFALGIGITSMYAIVTGDYDSSAYQAMPYLQTGGVISNFIYGIKTAFSYSELNSWKRVHELGKSIEDIFSENSS